jgi:hypothetical protein
MLLVLSFVTIGISLLLVMLEPAASALARVSCEDWSIPAFAVLIVMVDTASSLVVTCDTL